MDVDFEESDDYSVTECSRCGTVRKCIWSNDPYIGELYPEDENEPSYWCYDCLDTRSGDT